MEVTSNDNDDPIHNTPEKYKDKPVINVPRLRFGSSPIDEQSEQNEIHQEQMNYINKHSESGSPLNSILTPFLMQTAHGDESHPQQPYLDTYLLSYDGEYIHAFLLLHENSREHYTYLICHGILHQIEDLSSLADRFYKNFGNVLIIDYRGFGNSSGKQSERGAYIDVQTAFDYLLTLNEIDRKRIIIYGVSMGVALAIQLATEPHNSENIHACILENGFTSFEDVASEKSEIARVLPSVMFPVGMRSIDKVHQLHVPVMYLVGLKDEMIKPKHTIELYQNTTNSKYACLQSYDDAEHTNVTEMPDYINRSHIPFMQAAWNAQNQDESIIEPPILVIDHQIFSNHTQYENFI